MQLGNDRPMSANNTIESQSLQRIGRAGWVVRGLVYFAFAVTVAALAGAEVGNGGESADVQGGVDLIGEVLPGPVLYVVAGGVALYALWRFAEAAMPGDWGGKALVERIGKGISGIIYAGLAWLTFRSASGGGSSSSSGSGSGSGGIASDLLDSTPGRLLLGVIGLIILGVGIYKLKRGIDRDFLDSIDHSEVPVSRDTVEKLGVVGHIGRAIVYGILGGFVVAAAATYDAEKASGVDQALTEVAHTSWGRPLLAFTAFGLAAYGIYCVVTATGQCLERPGS